MICKSAINGCLYKCSSVIGCWRQLQCWFTLRSDFFDRIPGNWKGQIFFPISTCIYRVDIQNFRVEKKILHNLLKSCSVSLTCSNPPPNCRRFNLIRRYRNNSFQWTTCMNHHSRLVIQGSIYGTPAVGPLAFRPIYGTPTSGTPSIWSFTVKR